MIKQTRIFLIVTVILFPVFFVLPAFLQSFASILLFCTLLAYLTCFLIKDKLPNKMKLPALLSGYSLYACVAVIWFVLRGAQAPATETMIVLPLTSLLGLLAGFLVYSAGTRKRAVIAGTATLAFIAFYWISGEQILSNVIRYGSVNGESERVLTTPLDFRFSDHSIKTTDDFEGKFLILGVVEHGYGYTTWDLRELIRLSNTYKANNYAYQILAVSKNDENWEKLSPLGIISEQETVAYAENRDYEKVKKQLRLNSGVDFYIIKDNCILFHGNREMLKKKLEKM